MKKLRSLLNHSPFFIRLLNWEYWPFYIVQFPVAWYYLWLAFKARSFFYFSASNPSIETGGMFGESKWKIFELIPKHLYPVTILIKEGTDINEVITTMQEKNIHYPIIAKPDRGERGWKVSKLKDEDELKNYILSTPIDFLIQAYVSLPIEISVFYFRFPDQQKGTISSVVTKEMLHVTGDGKSTLVELIKAYPRALLQLPILKVSLKDKLYSIPAKDEVVELVPFGNHSRGAKFVDACHIIDQPLTDVFDEISKQIPGFYFGRYDMRCKSIEALKAGKEMQILELNGAGAEPAHVYHPGASLWKAYGVFIYHFKIMYEISKANHNAGIPYMNWAEFMQAYKLQKAYTAKANGIDKAANN